MRLSNPRTIVRGAAAAVVGLVLAVLLASAASAQQAAPTLQQLRNATYPTPYRASKSITLVDGKFDSLAEHVSMTFVDATFGTLNGAPIAVVHTATNTGGSGVFSEIYLVDGSLKPFGPGFLGDRLKNVKIQIVDNKIFVDMITQGPSEPLCCGTAPARQTWELQNGALVRTSQTFAQIQPPAPVRPAATGNAGIDATRHTPASGERGLLLLAVVGLVVLVRTGSATPHRSGEGSIRMM